MPDIAKLGLEVDATGAVRSLRDFDNKLETTGNKAATVARYIKNTFGVLGVSLGGFAIFQKFIRETEEAQRQQAQLQAVLRSTGGAAGRTAQYLNDMADRLQRISVYSDDAITSAQALLLTFTRIRGDEFDKATKAILDMSTAMGTDLRSSALQVGKALNDPIEGVSALQRVGVSFSEAQKDVIKHLVETGRAAQAQQLILKELQVEFGGSAEAARNTLGGSLRYLGNQWDNLFERTDDSTRGMINAINTLADNLPSVARKFDTFFNGLITGFAGLKIGYLRDAADIQRVLAFSNELAAKFPGLPSSLRSKMESDAKAQRKFIEETEREIERSRSRLLNSFGDVTSGSSSTAPKKAVIETTTDLLEKQTKAVKELGAAYSHNGEILSEFIARMYALVQAQKESEANERRRAFGISNTIGSDAARDISRRGGFDNLVNQDILKRFTKHVGDLSDATEKAARTISQAIEYYVVNKVGGGGFGASLGASVAKGAFSDLAGGFAKTALGASLFNPIVAGLGAAVGGVIDGLDLFGIHAREAARQLKELQKAAAQSLTSFHNEALGLSGSLQSQLDDKHARAEAERRTQEASHPRDLLEGIEGTARPGSRLAQIYKDIKADEEAYIARLKEEARIKNEQFKEDLQVRLLRAQGREKQADQLALKLQQQRELAQLDEQIRLGLADQATRALLLQVQAAELLKKTVDQMTTSVRNAPSGFKIESYIQQVATARHFNPPVMPVFTPTSTGLKPNAPVVMNFTGAVFKIDAKDKSAREAFDDWAGELSRRKSVTVGPNAPVADALDFLVS